MGLDPSPPPLGVGNINNTTIILQFSAALSRISETPKRFPVAYFNYQTMHAMHQTVHASFALFTGSYNLQEYWELDLFWASGGRLCLSFPKLCIFRPQHSHCEDFYCIQKTDFFEAHFCELPTKLTKVNLKKFWGFNETLICRCYTLRVDTSYCEFSVNERSDKEEQTNNPFAPQDVFLEIMGLKLFIAIKGPQVMSLFCPRLEVFSQIG